MELDRYFFPPRIFICRRKLLYSPTVILVSNTRRIFFGKKIARYSPENPIFVKSFLPRDSLFPPLCPFNKS